MLTLDSHSFKLSVQKIGNYSNVTGFVLLTLFAVQSLSGILVGVLPIFNISFYIKKLHAINSSIIMWFMYFHMFKSFYNKSYLGGGAKVVYSTGATLFILVMATCFTGYLIPWGQMSYWGTMVVSELLSVLPIIGDKIRGLMWGATSLSKKITVNRFLFLHITLGFTIWVFIASHIASAHKRVSVRVPLKSTLESLGSSKMYSDYFIKDIFITSVILFLFGVCLMYYLPTFELSLNNVEANPKATPSSIIPEWYFLVGYASLKYVQSKFLGALLSVLLIISPLLIPLKFIVGNTNINNFKFLLTNNHLLTTLNSTSLAKLIYKTFLSVKEYHSILSYLIRFNRFNIFNPFESFIK